MKKFISLAMTAAILMSGNLVASAATDFREMKTEDLATLRGKLQNESIETREAFTKEWQQRVGNMGAEEKQKYGIHDTGTGNQPAGQDPSCQ
ncbi:MAG: hypothetical protein HGB02_07405 [Chlorobiaceae bacterium]|nr:hypothetical protein [Chlorobiaceae bacterium]